MRVRPRTLKDRILSVVVNLGSELGARKLHECQEIRLVEGIPVDVER